MEQHDRLDEVRERTTRFVGLPEMPHSRDRFGRARVERVGLDGRRRLFFFPETNMVRGHALCCDRMLTHRRDPAFLLLVVATTSL